MGLMKIARPKWILGSALAAMLLLAYYCSTMFTPQKIPNSQRLAGRPYTEPRYESNDNSKNILPLDDQLLPLVNMKGDTSMQVKYNSLDTYTNDSSIGDSQCSVLHEQSTDIDSYKEFPNFEFQPLWMRSKEYWNKSFEDRYEMQKRDPNRPPLKIIIVPHSHNDPGWLYTFEHYFQLETKKIINQVVAKLQQYPAMTFIWSEISFLSAWWDSAHPTKRKALKKLIQSGQLEITTGGWVMPDEANTHLYALLDQFIEGHQWLKNNLEVSPESGWSIDPFGHGATVPYMLSRSGIQGAVIQRIHYAWKQWFAQHQWGDFLWQSPWASKNPTSLLTHNQPFDIYSIKHSCGPHPYICLNFDFRKIKGEYTEYSIKAEFINDKNVKAKAELLLEQYARTGSLLPHNVALIPLGDDFRYNKEVEFDQQYVNYKKLADYINENKDLYNAEITFGTPRDYFKAVKERYDRFPTFKGDFFVYSDIFTEGRPAYWSGYFTTRPFLKMLDRELEHNLRNAEILFTIALNTARQKEFKDSIRLFEKNYETLIKARRNLGLFQHHDAITGTSKANVMRDYGLKIFESLQEMVKLQEYCLEIIYLNITTKSVDDQIKNFILNDLERESYDKLPRKVPIVVNKKKQIILFNSLLQNRSEVVILRINTTDVVIKNSSGEPLNFQINPVWALNSHNKVEISTKEFEVMFIAELPPLSVITFYLSLDSKEKSSHAKKATIYCNNCINDLNQTTNVPTQDTFNPGIYRRSADNNEYSQSQAKQESHPVFNMKKTLSGDIQLENLKQKLLVDGFTGFLKSIMKKQTGKIHQCVIEFGAYQSAQVHSGAYLFRPDVNNPEKDVLDQYSHASDSVEGGRSNIIFIISGPISTQVTTVYGPFLAHTLRIYNTDVDYLSESIHIENVVDFERPPKNRETELFIRFQTDIQNGDVPQFYTDQNGFQYQKRIKVEKIGIEGNYFPITTMAFLQDQEWRMTYVTGHAQGASAYEPGRLEVMMDRRTLYDDNRGMGEGLVDNRKTVFRSWLLAESLKSHNARTKRNLPKDFEGVNFISPRTKREIFRNFPQRQGVVKESIREFTPNDSSSIYELPSYNALHFSQKLNYPVNIFTVDSVDSIKPVTAPISLLQTPFPRDVHLVTLRTLTDSKYIQFPSRSCLLVIQRMGYKCDDRNRTINSLPSSSPFIGLQIQSMAKVSLTGLHKEKDLRSLSEIDLAQMDLQTVNMTFV